MNKKLRKAIIAGNWKMNKTPTEATELMNELLKIIPQNPQCEVLVCPPFMSIAAAQKAAEGSNIKVGAQNCHFAEQGAYTGEISAQMLVDMQVPYVIIGHSERRAYFAETDTTVNLRLKAAIGAGLTAIVCVGESLAQRDAGETKAVYTEQVTAALAGVPAEKLEKVVLAYEPIWAIGTGKTATTAQAEEVCKGIRQQVSQLYSDAAGDAMSILYGGSMNAKNAEELLMCENIDGGLIGGAALKAGDFYEIVMAASDI